MSYEIQLESRRGEGEASPFLVVRTSRQANRRTVEKKKETHVYDLPPVRPRLLNRIHTPNGENSGVQNRLDDKTNTVEEREAVHAQTRAPPPRCYTGPFAVPGDFLGSEK